MVRRLSLYHENEIATIVRLGALRVALLLVRSAVTKPDAAYFGARKLKLCSRVHQTLFISITKSRYFHDLLPGGL